MPVYLGATEITDLKLGTTEIDNVYLGTTQVWPPAGGVVTPSVVGWGSAVITNVASVAVTISSGTDPGAVWDPMVNDFVLLFPSSVNTVTAVNPNPADWSNVLGVGQHLNAGAALGFVLFYHFVTSAEATANTTTYGPTVFQAVETGNVAALVVRGVNLTTPIHKVLPLGDASTTTVTPHVLPALTGANQPTISGCLVVGGLAKDSLGTWTTPGGWSAIVSNNTNQGKWIGTRTTPTTAGTDVAATNVTPSGGDEYGSFTLALAPV